LIEGQNVSEEALMISLGNAKQMVVGKSPVGVILHVAANSAADFGNAFLKFAQVPGVTGVLTLVLRE
jgi:hypothetical protein